MKLPDDISKLLEQYEPEVRRAFLEGISNLRNAITLRAIEDRLRVGDVDGAIEAMRLDAAAFARLEAALTASYDGAGIAAIKTLPAIYDPQGHRLVLRFKTRNTAGEAALRQHSADMVVGITDDLKAAARTALTEGLAAGKNPQRIVRDVVGRPGPGGKLGGGTLGLTDSQTKWVQSYRAALESGDAQELAKLIGQDGRALRDKRYDAAVKRAIREGKPIPADKIEGMVAAYNNRALAYRAKKIGETETFAAMGMAQHDAMQQQIDAGHLDAQDVTKVWHHSAVEQVPRQSHLDMDGQEVPFNTPFIMPGGALRFPHDPAAPISERIGCRCWFRYKQNAVNALARKMGKL